MHQSENSTDEGQKKKAFSVNFALVYAQVIMEIFLTTIIGHLTSAAELYMGQGEQHPRYFGR